MFKRGQIRMRKKAAVAATAGLVLVGAAGILSVSVDSASASATGVASPAAVQLPHVAISPNPSNGTALPSLTAATCGQTSASYANPSDLCIQITNNNTSGTHQYGIAFRPTGGAIETAFLNVPAGQTVLDERYAPAPGQYDIIAYDSVLTYRDITYTEPADPYAHTISVARDCTGTGALNVKYTDGHVYYYTFSLNGLTIVQGLNQAVDNDFSAPYDPSLPASTLSYTMYDRDGTVYQGTNVGHGTVNVPACSATPPVLTSPTFSLTATRVPNECANPNDMYDGGTVNIDFNVGNDVTTSGQRFLEAVVQGQKYRTDEYTPPANSYERQDVLYESNNPTFVPLPNGGVKNVTVNLEMYPSGTVLASTTFDIPPCTTSTTAPTTTPPAGGGGSTTSSGSGTVVTSPTATVTPSPGSSPTVPSPVSTGGGAATAVQLVQLPKLSGHPSVKAAQAALRAAGLVVGRTVSPKTKPGYHYVVAGYLLQTSTRKKIHGKWQTIYVFHGLKPGQSLLSGSVVAVKLALVKN